MNESLHNIWSFVAKNDATCVLAALGIWGILKACFARQISMGGDVGLDPREEKPRTMTPELRLQLLLVSVPTFLWSLLLFFYRAKR